jgi:hypothetical protein
MRARQGIDLRIARAEAPEGLQLEEGLVEVAAAVELVPAIACDLPALGRVAGLQRRLEMLDATRGRALNAAQGRLRRAPPRPARAAA